MKKSMNKHEIILRKAIEQEVFVDYTKYQSGSLYRDKSVKWLFDFRAVLLQSEILDAYCEAFYERYKNQYPFQICGLEIAAVPLVAALVMKFHEKGRSLNGFFIRKSRKKSGLFNMVEGKVTGDPIIIVDDLVNTGSSVMRQVIILKELEKKVLEVFSILRFRNSEYYTNFKNEGIAFSSLFELNDLEGSLRVVNIENYKRTQPIPSPFHDVLWVFKGGNPNLAYVVPKSAPVVSDGLVYFGTDDGNFFALDIVSGKTVWRYKVPFGSRGKYIFSTPAVYHEIVYFGAYDGNVYALDKRTGQKRWVFMEADWVGSSPCIADDLGMIFIGLEYGLFTKKGGVSCIDAQTGKKIWEFRSLELTHGSPVYSKRYGLVACGSNDHILSVLNAKTGKRVWSFKTRGDIKGAACFSDEHGVISVIGFDEIVYVLDTKTGSEVSHFKMEFGAYNAPIIFQDTVICASFDKNIYCFNLFTGDLVWKYYTGARCFATPVIIKGKLYVGSNNAKLYEMDPETGEVIGIFQTRERITNKVAYDEKTSTFFVSTFANEVLALKK